MTALEHPPRPRFALNVAVVGHRPNRLPRGDDAVAARVREALEGLSTAAAATLARHSKVFDGPNPSLRLVSSLAEGADRIAAAAARELGYSLHHVLPFAADEYANDFSGESSRAQFARLIEQGETLVLHGMRSQEARAYELAGRTVIAAADVVLAVWDGGASGGRGGTTELLSYAAQQGLPILHVDASGAAPTLVLWEGFAVGPAKVADVADLPAASAEAIAAVVERVLAPPESGDEPAALRRFLGERHAPRNLRVEMPALLALLGLRALRRADLYPEHPVRVADRLSREVGGAAKLGSVAEAYGWADALGNRYAQAFRSAYSVNFVLAALAVTMAVAPLVTGSVLGWSKWPFVAVEIGLVLLIVANTSRGRRHDYHGRWLQAREVAERLRAGVLPWLLGGKLSGNSVPGATWTGWYARALFRAVGARAGSLDQASLSSVAATIAGVVRTQCAYHLENARRMRRIEHRLERIGDACFALALLVAAAYLAATAVGWHGPVWWGQTVTALTAGLPALGSATFGVRLIGDFRGTAERSTRTAAELGAVVTAMDGSSSLTALNALAEAAESAMLGDVASWRLSRETRPLALPG